MASLCLSTLTLSKTLIAPLVPNFAYAKSSSYSSNLHNNHVPMFSIHRNQQQQHPRFQSLVVRMAPDEEKLTRRNPLDFPIEWERPKPGRRPDIFPQFSPMKTPLPSPSPYDPPEEDDEEEEEKKEEEEEDPETEEPDK